MMGRQEAFHPIVTDEDGVTTLAVTWREPLPASVKWNPVWWLGNDWDSDPPAWSLPGRPMWFRRWNWFWRNPAENFKRWVLGIGDRNYVVALRGNSWWTTRNGTEPNWELGWVDGFLPWISYAGPRFRFYVGWQPVGVAAIKFNRWAVLFSPLFVVLVPAMIVWRIVYGMVRKQ